MGGGSETTRISLVRHGRVHNPNRILYGRLPRFRLSDRGREEAAAAARRLAGDPVAAVYTSPMLRARQTARVIAEHQNGSVPMRQSKRIVEVCSPFQGRPSADADRAGWNLYDGAGCEFEQPVDIVERVRRFIRRVRRLHPGGHVAAVTHGDVIAFTLLWAMEIPLHPNNRIDLGEHGFPARYPATGSICTMAFDGDDGDRPLRIGYWKPDGPDLA